MNEIIVPFYEQKIEVQQQPFWVLGVHTRACIFLKKERDCQAMEVEKPAQPCLPLWLEESMPTMRKGSIRLSGFALSYCYQLPIGLYLDKRKGLIVHE